MTILVKYILSKYLKYFLIILLSLEIFFVGIDLLQNFKKLPNSANLQILYILYTSFFSITIVLPLSLIFSWIITLTSFIKNNEMVSFYSLGVSKKMILMPVLIIMFLIITILVILQSTPLAYSYSQKNKIIDNHYFSNERVNIFLKYNNYFIYFGKLYPIQKIAQDVHIFKIKDNDIVERIIAKKAYYQQNRWYVVDANITYKPKVIDWDNSKIKTIHKDFLYTLEEFEPKIINNVYKSKPYYSTIDAIKTIILLENQNFNTNKIKVILYSQLFKPYFVIPLAILIFLFIGASSRFFNSAKFISTSILLTLIIWGIMFLLEKFSLGGIILAEVAIILPLICLIFITYYFYMKRVD